MFKLDPEQQAMVRRMAQEATGGVLNASETGCIQGDAELIVNRGGKSFRITLKELVHMFNGGSRGRWGHGYTWDPDIPTRVQRRADDGTVRLVNIVNAWFSGVKNTYTVTTETGRTIRATDEHPFYTEDGWKRLDELRPGTRVYVRGEQSGSGRKPKNYYLYRNKLTHHPLARSTKNQPDLNRVATHRLVVEADMNGLNLEDYIKALRTGEGVENFEFLRPEQVVHHMDQNHKNNTLENLEVHENNSGHIRLHSKEFQRHVLYKTELDTVVSIEPYGEEETYDIEVEDDPHNFIANGFVVHNTGKTLMTVELAREIGAQSILIVGPANPKVRESWERTFQVQGLELPFSSLTARTKSKFDVKNPGRGVWYVSKDFMRYHDQLSNPDYVSERDKGIAWHKAGFDMVIADEAHFGSNRKAKTTRVLWRLHRVPFRVALSATPQGSNFAGFWALCRFLWYNYPKPGVEITDDMPLKDRYIIDSSYSRWSAEWCDFQTVYTGQKDHFGNPKTVKQVIGPKGDDPRAFVESLPCYVSMKATRFPTHTRRVYVELNPEQKRIHDELAENALAWLNENDYISIDYPIVKKQRLRQVTLATPELDEEGGVVFDLDGPSAKIDAIRKIRALEPEERILVLTTSEKFTQVVKHQMPDALLWTGPTSKKARMKNLDTFLETPGAMMVATYGAIAEGMDGLQHVCRTEVWADEPYSTVQATQVEGRLNRRGQTRDIIRYRLLAEDSADTQDFENIISKIKSRKSEL